MAGSDVQSDLIRGNIDAMLLRVLSEEDCYGYEILKRIARASGGAYEMPEPSLYSCLKRLERNGFIEGYWGDASQGARRKYYRITDAGRIELGQARARWMRARDVIDQLLETRGGNR